MGCRFSAPAVRAAVRLQGKLELSRNQRRVIAEKLRAARRTLRSTDRYRAIRAGQVAARDWDSGAAGSGQHRYRPTDMLSRLQRRHRHSDIDGPKARERPLTEVGRFRRRRGRAKPQRCRPPTAPPTRPGGPIGRTGNGELAPVPHPKTPKCRPRRRSPKWPCRPHGRTARRRLPVDSSRDGPRRAHGADLSK